MLDDLVFTRVLLSVSVKVINKGGNKGNKNTPKAKKANEFEGR